MFKSRRRQQREAEETMRAIASAVDSLLKRRLGRRYAFAVVVFEQEEGERTNYISNASREDTVTALRATADRLDTGRMLPPGAITDQRDN